MFVKPIRPQPIRSMDELFKFSYPTKQTTHYSKTFCQNNGQIAFSDESCHVWVTPYRSEVRNILDSAGYFEGSFFVPFSNGEKWPEAYRWLVKMAQEESWAETYEEAFKIASEKGIKPVSLKQKVHIKQVEDFYADAESLTCFSEMVMQFLHNGTEANIGTYIIVDPKTVILCDEYGRTFVVTVKTVINDVVNTLIEAGYTRTPHPEKYVHPLPKED